MVHKDAVVFNHQEAAVWVAGVFPVKASGCMAYFIHAAAKDHIAGMYYRLQFSNQFVIAAALAGSGAVFLHRTYKRLK